MNVMRGVNSAAVIEITANRSPIGNATILLSQRTPGARSSRAPGAEHAVRERALRPARGGRVLGGAARRASAAAAAASSGCSTGGCGVRADAPRCCVPPNEKSDMWRAVWSVIAAHASSHTGSPARLAPIARPANARYSFVRSNTESSHAPSLENCARVAGELAVDAVGRERELEQHRAGDQAPALAGRERDRGEQPDEHRDGRDLVRRKPAARRPARDVLRVRADEERREEAVGALDGRVEQHAVLVVLRDRRARPRRRRPATAGAPRTAGAGSSAPTCAPPRTRPDEQQRDGVVGRRREPVRAAGLVLVGEHDRRSGRPARRLVGRRRVVGLLRRARRRPRRRRPRGEPEPPAAGLARRAPRSHAAGGVGGQRARAARRPPASARRSPGATLSTPRNVAGRPVHGVVGRRRR